MRNNLNVLSQIKVWLEEGEEIFTNVNKTTTFGLMMQNIGQTSLPRIYINLIGPIEVKVIISKRELVSIPSKKLKKVVFKIKPKQNGVFTLIVAIRTKRHELVKVPLILRVGMTDSIQQPVQQPITNEDPKEEKSLSLLKCPYCGDKLKIDSNFCSGCGSNLKEKGDNLPSDYKLCPNCNSMRPSEVKYCGYCGTEFQITS